MNIHTCEECRLSKFCISTCLPAQDQESFKSNVHQKLLLKSKEDLFKADKPLKSIYVLRSGSLKTIKVNTSGSWQITGFYYPSDILGLDGIYLNKYPNSAVSLETSSVCEIRLSKFTELVSTIPNLLNQFINVMSERINELSCGFQNCSAEQRLALFLLNISNKMKRIGISGANIYLRMSREDIGNYLGLAGETVSRILTKFKDLGLIKLNSKSIDILDFKQLIKISDSIHIP